MSRQTFYFSDGPYLQAMQGLHSALSGAEAFVKFIGQPRTGKSGVCEKLTHYMRHKGHRVVYFDYAVESPDMLRSMLAKELDVPDTFNMLRHLEDSLAEGFEKPLIFLFDDAHQLSDITLIEIYRLASVQVERKRVINIVLCGEPELERRLSGKKQFAALLQHVTHNFLLEPMDAESTARFVQAYLAKMGLGAVRFEAAASNLIYKSSRGFPGPAYSLSQLVSTLRQPDEEQTAISREELLRAIRGVDSEQPVPSGLHRMGDRRKIFAPLAAVMVIASLALLLQILSPAEEQPQEAIDGTPDTAVLSVPSSPAASPFALDELDANPAAADSELSAAAELDATAQDEETIESPLSPQEVLAEAPVPAPEGLPASDSSLALVTALERGIAQEEIAEPEFEQLDGAADAAGGAGLPASGVLDEPRVEREVAQLGSVTLTRPMLALDDEELPEPAAPAPVNVATAQDLVLSENPGTEEPPAASERMTPQAVVQRWLDAWQGQDLEEYFASYAAEFVPRYHRSRAAWRSNRERVIGGASQITLELSGFEVIAEDAETVEVHFWLAYRSPSYRDDTRKKLVLKKLPPGDGVSERLVILEEINLEVRA